MSRSAPKPSYLVASLLLALACACGQPHPQAANLARQGRFGSLRDLLLIDRANETRHWLFFIDRFEVTRGDWNEFAATAVGRQVLARPVAVELALPIANVTLAQARAFAAWRCLRLPQFDEWRLAMQGDGRYRFPWGSREDPTRANTSELGLGEATPVGAFESGRQSDAGQPYDLIGNVSEWTETLPLAWCARERADEALGLVLDPLASYSAQVAKARATPALASWQVLGLISPGWAAAAGGDQVPREVVGADFQTPMAQWSEPVPAGEHRSRIGIRLVATPKELLMKLCAESVAPSAEEMAQLRQFLARAGHRSAMLAAWHASKPTASTPLAQWLAGELGVRNP